MDWSGNADRDEFLHCIIVATENASAWSEICDARRHFWGMAQSKEFHAQSLKEWQLLAILESACECGFVFGITTVRRSETTRLFSYRSIAENTFSRFAARYAFKKLWYDTEIQGRKAEKEFETSLYRINREIYEKSTLKARCRESHKSDMVQAADVLAYVVHRQINDAIKDGKLRQLLQAILNDPRNV